MNQAAGARIHFLRAALILIVLGTSASASADDFIQIGYAEGAPGDTGIHLIITAANSTPIHGLSLAIQYPADALSIRRVETVGTHLASLEPEFEADRVDNQLGIASLAIILSYDNPDEGRSLAPITNEEAARIVARLTVDIRPDAAGGTYPIRLVDNIGSPPAYNRFTQAGTSIAPRLVHGSFRIDGGDVLRLESRRAFAGIGTPSLPFFVFAQHPDDLAGFSIAVSYSCSSLELLEASLSQTTVDAELGRIGRVDFFQTDVDDTIGGDVCRSRTAVIFEYPGPFEIIVCPVPVLGPSPDLETQTLLRLRFRIDAAASDGVEFRDISLRNLSSTDLNNTLLIDRCPDSPRSVLPETIDGKVFFSTGTLEGRAVEALSGDPISGVVVRTHPESYETISDANGRFVFRDIIPGSYDLRLRRREYYSLLERDISVAGGGATDDTGDLSLYKVPRQPEVGPGKPFRRGDSNADLRIDISDGVFILNYLFVGGSDPSCYDSLDADDSGVVNISDGVFMFNYLFLGGGPPPSPGPQNCGLDETRDTLTCLGQSTCQ